MTTKKLDRSRKFGTVVGATDGSLYHQDGCCFNGDGELVGAGPAAPPPAPAATPEPPAGNPAAISREQLQALHATKINKLVEMEGLTLETGAGSKARNIENLLAAG